MTFYAIHTRKQVMVNIDPPGGTTKVKENTVYNEGAKLIFKTFAGMLIGALAGIGVAYLLGWLPS